MLNALFSSFHLREPLPTISPVSPMVYCSLNVAHAIMVNSSGGF